MVVINFVLYYNIKKKKKKKKKKELSEKQELKTTRDKSKYIILFCFVEVTVLFC